MFRPNPVTFYILCFLVPLTSDSYGMEDRVNVEPVSVVEPSVGRRVLRDARMDTEAFEVGSFAGILSVDGFNTNFFYGLSGTIHFVNRVIVQANTARSEIERATFEEPADQSIVTDSDRAFRHFDLQFGYNLFPGRSFFGTKSKFNSGIFLMAGIGNSQFTYVDGTTVILGSSYRVVLTDWLSFSIDFRDYIFRRNFLGDAKSTHNVSVFTGLNVLF